MNWTTLATAADWTAYQVATATKLCVPPGEVAWGSGPASYPCLISTMLMPRVPGTPTKMVSAYVYPADARGLLLAAGVQVPVFGAAPKGPNQAQFNRWVSANVLTVMYFLVETGICKPDQVEEKMLEMIDKVDAWSTEDRTELKKTLAKYESAVLGTLGGGD